MCVLLWATAGFKCLTAVCCLTQVNRILGHSKWRVSHLSWSLTHTSSVTLAHTVGHAHKSRSHLCLNLFHVLISIQWSFLIKVMNPPDTDKFLWRDKSDSIFSHIHSHQTAVITVELEYQISSVLKLTHHETGLHGPIPINPVLLVGGQGAKEALCGLAVGVC